MEMKREHIHYVFGKDTIRIFFRKTHDSRMRYVVRKNQIHYEKEEDTVSVCIIRNYLIPNGGSIIPLN